ncbi:MAG: Branched-chain amino acid transport ATP-binding protein LivF [uncultured Thermomicrobiales bacterium]|uniref:Branched-chain amino acid transport ATP-binding protein LivF n=1 Tax=uncultured Thermomicrobiales bacterium TaxID=1645740 RepID=A0A6J4V832_9BACT|nr:MAG: Branched-chain amino acid transport ATP-binding protein LivF [uncultured Thermomicrobiales bacterium]
MSGSNGRVSGGEATITVTRTPTPEAPPAAAAPRSAAGGAPMLTVRNLSKRFGGVRAVDGVSFEVLPGQTVSVIGPNGSGKTTLFNLLAGALRPDGGEVVLAGERTTGRPAERIAELGLARTFQNGRVFGNMTVGENVLLGRHTRQRAARPLAALRHIPVVRWLPLVAETLLALARPAAVRREEGEAEAAVERQLGRFRERLLPRRDDLAFSLSYANRRRTEIARALAMEPRLLLLDEPTAGMNQTETAEVLDQLRQLRAAGQTIVLVEHKLDLVMELSDRVVVLDHGQVIADGPPAAVQADERVVEAYLGRRRAVPRDGRERTARLAPPPAPAAAIPPPDRARPSAATLLKVEKVDVFYGPVKALAEVSLEVGAGEIVCLLGGNASGKSTTMKTILGLLTPRAGRVLLGGEDVTGRPTADRIRRGLASVPEARRLFPDMTVAENLLMGAYLRRDGAAVREDAERMYALFPRLAERRRQAAGTMSGGEQQMLAMARALMSRPALICMDEPTMGLAPILVETVLETIATVNAQGVAVFMVEQNASLALSIADRGYVVQNGAIVLSGAAGALLDDPAVQEAYLGRRVAG